MRAPALPPETSALRARERQGQLELAPSIIAAEVALPRHRYEQRALAALAARFLPPLGVKEGAVARLFQRVGVKQRFLALPAERYSELRGLEQRNNAWIEVATSLGRDVVDRALTSAGLHAREISLLASTTVTGIAVPSLDARLMNRLPFDPALKRMPLFGLGCLGGAAGLARTAEYLRAFPDEAAVFLAVELCSLTFQAHDGSLANLISTGLFGDGAAAVVLAGARHPLSKRSAGPRIVASRSAFFANTERAMGWDVVDTGFRIVLSPDVPKICAEQVGPALDAFLGSLGMGRGDVASWIMHPGGPKILDALELALGLAPQALQATRDSLANIGNLSSASVLFLLEERRRLLAQARGEHCVLMAMGPAFCAEMVLLEW